MEAKQKNKKTETVSSNSSNNNIQNTIASSLNAPVQQEHLLNTVMTAFQQQGKSAENISVEQMKSMMEEVLKKVLTGQENGSAAGLNADEKFNLVEKRKRKERAGKPGGPQEQYIFHLKLEENKKKKKKSKKETSPTSSTSSSTPSSQTSIHTKKKNEEVESESNIPHSYTTNTSYVSNSQITPPILQQQNLLQTPTSSTSSFSSISASNLPPSLLQYDISPHTAPVNTLDSIPLNSTVNLDQLDEAALQKILIAKQQQSKKLQQQQQQAQQQQQVHQHQQQQQLLDVMQPNVPLSLQGSRRNSLAGQSMQQPTQNKKPSIISIILPAVLKASTPTIVSLMDGCILKVNENLCKLLGYPQHILEGTLIQNIIHPEDRANHHLILLQMLSANSDTCKHDIRMINFSGRVVRIYQEVCCVRNEMAVPQWVITKIVDVQYLEETVGREAFTLLSCSHGHCYIKEALLTHDSPMEFSDIFVNILEHLFGNLQPACFYDDQTTILWNNDSFDALFGVHGKPFKGRKVLELYEMRGSAMEILTRGVLKELPEKLEAQSSPTPVPALRKIITVKCYGQKISRPDGSLFGYLWLFTETYQEMLSELVTKEYLRTSSPSLSGFDDDLFKLTPSNSTDNLFGFSNFAYEGSMPMLNSNVIQNQLQRTDTPSKEIINRENAEVSQGEFPFFV